MIGLNLFHTQQGRERIDIYYSELTPPLHQIITIIKNEQPVLQGTLEDETFIIQPRDIYYFDTVDRKTFAYTKDKIYQIQQTLTALEQQLSSYGFVRINKSNIVNIYMIKKIKPEPNMKVSAILKNDEKLQINRGYKRSFEEYLKTTRKCM